VAGEALDSVAGPMRIVCNSDLEPQDLITLLSFGLSQLVFPFLYNCQYMNRMLTTGWRLDDTDPNYELAKQTLYIRRPL
jgi:hypothetical protein